MTAISTKLYRLQINDGTANIVASVGTDDRTSDRTSPIMQASSDKTLASEPTQGHTRAMHDLYCYVKDFGSSRFAVCELEGSGPNGKGFQLVAHEPIGIEPPTPALWARLGALLRQSGEVMEAQ